VPGGAGESAVARRISAWAEDAGLRTTWLEETPGRPSVVVRGGRAAGGRTLLLCGHLDVVGVDGMEAPFLPRLDGDRLYGRGTYDMKAGVVAALAACLDAAEAGIAGEVVVALVADEEHSSLGVQEVLRHVTADAAIVTEPTSLLLVTSHKGFIWTEVEVVGRAAHGSRPELGVDAIMKAGPVIVALAGIDPQLHASTIVGGREASTIPDHLLLLLERRTVPGTTEDAHTSQIEAVLDSCRAADPALVVSQRTTVARDPFATPPDALILELLRRHVPEEPIAAGFWADSAFIAAAGIPTVLFGPHGGGAHEPVEWVSIASTVRCAEVLTAVALDYCG
jgi:acetylornithine deacetylase